MINLKSKIHSIRCKLHLPAIFKLQNVIWYAVYSTLKCISTMFYRHHIGFLHSLQFINSLPMELTRTPIWCWYYFLFHAAAGFSTFYIGLTFTRTLGTGDILSTIWYVIGLTRLEWEPNSLTRGPRSTDSAMPPYTVHGDSWLCLMLFIYIMKKNVTWLLIPSLYKATLARPVNHVLFCMPAEWLQTYILCACSETWRWLCWHYGYNVSAHGHPL